MQIITPNDRQSTIDLSAIAFVYTRPFHEVVFASLDTILDVAPFAWLDDACAAVYAFVHTANRDRRNFVYVNDMAIATSMIDQIYPDGDQVMLRLNKTSPLDIPGLTDTGLLPLHRPEDMRVANFIRKLHVQLGWNPVALSKKVADHQTRDLEIAGTAHALLELEPAGLVIPSVTAPVAYTVKPGGRIYVADEQFAVFESSASYIGGRWQEDFLNSANRVLNTRLWRTMQPGEVRYHHSYHARIDRLFTPD